jgi:hypothetical protein
MRHLTQIPAKNPKSEAATLKASSPVLMMMMMMMMMKKSHSFMMPWP